ncbi:putative SOS response-associated peptidase YedK [Serratia plymuthica]|nr:SOS response-associated peptidase family protein [Serratia plymuthica]KYG13985.1 putative SOS response-associated peptidase YedK [Serratia plymuthica]
MFAPLWKHGRALVPASGWYEWKKSPDNPRLKQPYFIHSIDRQPLFFAALCATDQEGAASFVIITAASHDGLADIHDRCPLAAAARDWLDSWLALPPGDMLTNIYSLQMKSFACCPCLLLLEPFAMTVHHSSWLSIHQKPDPALSTVLVDNMCASPRKIIADGYKKHSENY